jgi:cysteine synthase B
MTCIYDSIQDLVGQTPLLAIPQKHVPGVTIYAKLEYFNPSGSVKDRAARFMIQDALAKGQLEGRRLLEATSGNTGIALAMMCGELGIPIELALPENASAERKLLLQKYGATLHLTSPMEGTDGAQLFAINLAESNPDLYFYPDQYNNENNWKAHYQTTGPEIWAQTDGHVTNFITGLGTSGTFMGTSRFLKEKKVHCTAVHPNNPLHGLEGWKHMETARVPGIYDASVADSHVETDTEDAFRTAILFARRGLAISPSAAANLNSALQLAHAIQEGVIVTIITDNAMKYLQDGFWSQPHYQHGSPFE